MFLSDISIRRPVLATVFSLLLVVFGVISFERLPVREYPDIDPPVVSVEARYPGAAAAVVNPVIAVTGTLTSFISPINSDHIFVNGLAAKEVVLKDSGEGGFGHSGRS